MVTNADGSVTLTTSAGLAVTLDDAAGTITINGDTVNLPGMPMIAKPPSGGYISPWHVFGAGAAAPTSGRVTFLPIDVNRLTANAIGFNQSVVAVGGSSLVTVGIYGDDGTGMRPNLADLRASGTLNPTTAGTGNKWVTIANTELHGRVWLAFLYVASSAPSTAPQFLCVNNNVMGAIGPNSAVPIGTTLRGLALTGQTALPGTGTPVGSGNADVITMALRAA